MQRNFKNLVGCASVKPTHAGPRGGTFSKIGFPQRAIVPADPSASRSTSRSVPSRLKAGSKRPCKQKHQASQIAEVLLSLVGSGTQFSKFSLLLRQFRERPVHPIRRRLLNRGPKRWDKAGWLPETRSDRVQPHPGQTDATPSS